MIQKYNTQQAKQYIKEADAILITAVAGIGVDSGLKEKKLAYSAIVNSKWFKENPSLIWNFYVKRLNFYNKTTSHKGFILLLDLVNNKHNNYFVYTSNVDGQLQKAGFDVDKLLKIHASIHYLQCIENCHDKVFLVDSDLKNDFIPKCPYCRSITKSNILMFADYNV